MMKNVDLSAASCAICGAGVHIDDHEGRVACDSCGMPTDNCQCTGEGPEERSARRTGTA